MIDNRHKKIIIIGKIFQVIKYKWIRNRRKNNNNKQKFLMEEMKKGSDSEKKVPVKIWIVFH